MIKVLLVDDQYLIRDGIKSLLMADPEIEVIAMASNGYEACDLCKTQKPDIVLMDIYMPKCDGIEATRIIKAAFPEVKVIILTTFNDDENIRKALKNGADGYILKDIAPEGLITALKASLNNVKILHQETLSNVVNKINISKINKENLNLNLTERERTIIALIVDGKSNAEIASVLFISEGSVRNLVSAILQKLNVKDRIALAVFALKNDIV